MPRVAAANETGFTLPMKTVIIRPVKRKGQWLPDNHSGSFLYDNSYITMEVPIDARTGRRVQVLTKEEREFFENSALSGLDFKPGDLSENRRENNFWEDFVVSLRKSEEPLDLSDPMTYLQYAVLRANTGAHGLVAPSWTERFNYPTYRYAIVDEDFDAVEGSKKADNNMAAYTFFSSIKDSYEKMYDFLMVYWLENKGAERPSPNSKKDMLTASIDNLINNELSRFLKVAKDSVGYEKKLFLHRAIENGHIEYNGKDTYKLMPEEDIIGSSVSEAVDYLFSPKNQETMLRIRALIEQKNK